MSNTGTIALIILVVNVVFSYKGFTNEQFFDRYKFEVDKILINKDYKRLITSGFLHVSWMHLIVNMISLMLFSGSVEGYLGGLKFLIVYVASLIGGDLFTLLVHKNHGDYTSVGASGAVCGIIFASIALFPGMSVGLFVLPISIPGWLFGILFVLYSIYGIKSQNRSSRCDRLHRWSDPLHGGVGHGQLVSWAGLSRHRSGQINSGCSRGKALWLRLDISVVPEMEEGVRL